MVSSPPCCAMRGVRMEPGATAFTRTLEGASSTAADFTSEMSPALADP